jgi:DNA invertase Pin-like site-specific DNA recombinase
MKRLAYLRVSTSEQSHDRQIMGLKGLADKLFIETVSAVARKRPVYEQVMAALEPGDTFVIYSLDRAYRSVTDAITQLDALNKRGVNLHIANFNLDTRTPPGKFMFVLLGAFAEFERDILVERTKEGLAAARARGKQLGRPRKLSEAQLKKAKAKLDVGDTTFDQVAKEFGVGGWTLSRALKRSEMHVPLN